MPTPSTLIATSAAGLHEQLQLLKRERMTATLAGVAAGELYMADLLAEIEATRNAYVGAAVTEIASLRAELDGPLFG
jgi:multidrug resistance efflux pump